VLWIGCSGEESLLYLEGPVPSLEQHRTELENRMLTADELEALCVKREGSSILNGLFWPRCWQGEGEEGQRTAQALVFALQLAKERFRWILLDGGAFPLNRAIEPLAEAADLRFLVLTQLESAICTAEGILKPEAAGWHPVVNRYFREDPHDLFYLEKRLGCSAIPVEASLYGRRAEWEHKTLLETGGRACRRSLSALADAIRKEGNFCGSL